MIFDDLYLWYLGDPEHPRYIGHLALSGKGVSLQYDDTWQRSGFALSEDLPLGGHIYFPPSRLSSTAGLRAVGAVDDARPDRWGERVIRCIDQPSRLSLMEYLYYAGDDRFGALGVSSLRDRYAPKTNGPLPRLNAVQELNDVAIKIINSEPLSETEERLFAGVGSPLGGAKPKALIEIDGREWVIKFFHGEQVDAPLIEHASMTLASKAGICVARTRPIRLTGSHALAIERFDRHGLRRIHSISAGTALRAATPDGQEPDLGYPSLALLLRRAGDSSNSLNLTQAAELFRRMVFNVLIDNTDDHEKNHALLIKDPFNRPRFELAPAYDVLPCNSGQGRQEFICGDKGLESTIDNAMSQCELFGLTTVQATQEVKRVIDVVSIWQSHFRQCGVTDRDISELARQIDGAALLRQRKGFDPARFTARKKAKRTNPFAPAKES